MAFRYYSRGYISYHFFVKADEDCRYKYRLRNQLLNKFKSEADEARKFLKFSIAGLKEISKNMIAPEPFRVETDEETPFGTGSSPKTLSGFEDFLIFQKMLLIELSCLAYNSSAE